MKKFGFLFDMDGVVVDNHEYHFQAWQLFCKNHGIELTESFYKENVNGRPLKNCLETIFKREFTVNEAHDLGDEKEATYRQVYAPFLELLKGLQNFLVEIQDDGHGIALATSGPKENVDFVLDGLNIRHFFQSVIDSSGVTHGKPHPEIYRKSAENLRIDYQDCVVFEDSLLGIQSGRDAGCKVVGVATTHPREELRDLDKVIEDFSTLGNKQWRTIFS
jgi:HAD superfamily hydrolase (TIGR01509 family)